MVKKNLNVFPQEILESFEPEENIQENQNIIPEDLLIEDEDINIIPEVIPENSNFQEFKRIGNTTRKKLVVVSYSMVIGDKKICRVLPKELFKSSAIDTKALVVASYKLMEDFFIELFYEAELYLKKLKMDPNLVISKSKSEDPSIVCYFHNLGPFDGYFLADLLLRSKYIWTIFNRKNLKINNVSGVFYSIQLNNIIFKDSYLMNRVSLNKLSTSLLNQNKKDYDILQIQTPDLLKNVLLDKKTLKKFALYNIQDSFLLYGCMQILQENFLQLFNIDITDSVSAPSLARNLFLRKYYFFPQNFFMKVDKRKNIITKYYESNTEIKLEDKNKAIFLTIPYLYNQLYQAYFGGRAELFLPLIEDQEFCYVDVNSLFPFAASAPLPFGPGQLKEQIGEMSKKEFKNFFGFMHVIFTSPPDMSLLPVLPRRRKNSNIVYALGQGEGWYFSKEVQLAFKMGYKIKVLATLKYTPVPGFRSFIKDLYKIGLTYPKNHANNILAKLNLNTGIYGNWAVKLNKLRMI